MQLGEAIMLPTLLAAGAQSEGRRTKHRTLEIEQQSVTATHLTNSGKVAIWLKLGKAIVIDSCTEDKCVYCKKKEHPFANESGNSASSGPTLRKNIIAEFENHSWYTGSWSLQAHHLICSEAMDDDNWPVWCQRFGYDINCKENGVMLPYFMQLACQLHVPLHRGGHDAGDADGMSYPRKIKTDIKKLVKK